MVRRTTVLALCVSLVISALASTARADTVPTGGDPATVSAVPLPTVQIDGVVWSQVIIGSTVYAAGSFSKARPAGAAPGTNETTRTNILAYNIATGVLSTTFKPSVNGQILSIAKSPDGSRLYIGGQFTSVNGQTRSRLAALDPATGAAISGFAPSVASTVRAIAATNTSVYFGGDFTSVGGQSRPRLAAVTAAGALLPWNPKANEQVKALTMNPGNTLVVAGGRFTTIGTQNWYGMAALDPASGAPKPWAVEQVIRTAGLEAAVLSLSADEDSVYGTSYTYGSGGNFEGTFRARGSDGALTWLADCHGDTYSVYPMGGVVYDASHRHYCGNTPDGFYDTNPRSYYHSTALSKAPAGVSKYNSLYRLTSFDGKPSPKLLHWYPIWSVGHYTGQLQAGWSVTANSQYVVYGGEFPAVNGKAQQGLVRFALSNPSSNNTAPQGGDSLTPAAVSPGPGTVNLGWQATFDRDNRSLTYQLFRGTTLINSQTVESTTWRRPTVRFTDNGAGSGAKTYQVKAVDPWGKTVASGTASVTVATANAGYASAVLASTPEHWFRMNDATGTKVRDSAGSAHATALANITGGTAGGVTGGGTAMTLNGTSQAFAATAVSQVGPQTFTVEAWIKTSTGKGGRIVGFGDRKDGPSKSEFTDRHLYMDNSGYVTFGVGAPSRKTLRSTKALNNNAWHHVVGTVGSDGMKLYIDGVQVASNASVKSARDTMGHWRIGGDTLDGWANKPSSIYFNGSVDEVAVYYRSLSASEVAGHYAAGK